MVRDGIKDFTGDRDIDNAVTGNLARGISKLILMMEENLSIKSILDWRHAKMQSGMLQNCFLALSTDSEVYQDLAGFMNLTAENTKTCITSTFDQLTGLFKASKALTEMMSGTTFSMEEIGKEKTAIFLVVPDEKTTYHFLAALYDFFIHFIQFFHDLNLNFSVNTQKRTPA